MYTTDSTPWWPEQAKYKPDDPNIVLILLDDVGFGQFGCYGSRIETPNIDRLAAGGLQYTNFTATPLCSPTRACVLTGRNHHSVGMGTIANLDEGYPNRRGRITPAAATLAEILRDQGYNTLAVGKWHLVYMGDTTAAGPYDQWPLGRGFERYYGFLNGHDDHFAPELVYDNHYVDAPEKENYHLTEDLVDRSIEFVRDQKSMTPEKPFFLYLCFGSCHSPHHAPAEYMEKYKGAFDDGWDSVREECFAHQKELGVVPPDTNLAPRNPGVKAWEELSEREQRVFCRMQEAFAGMLDHTDQHIGRLLEFLAEIDQMENTLVILMADNGASQEGGPDGVVNNATWFNGIATDIDAAYENIDDIGGPRSDSNYPWGWAQAGNVPLKWYKQNTHGGGVRVPFIINWPKAISDQGSVRHQFHHAIDIAPTILDILGREAPEMYRGIPQKPIDGISMAYTFNNPDAPTQKETQYFENSGHRGIYHQGWKAVTRHVVGTLFEEEEWELYNLEEDFSESNNLASEYPDKLNEMVQRWWVEAAKHGVLPLMDRRGGFAALPRPGDVMDRKKFVFYGAMQHVDGDVTPNIKNRSYSITADVERDQTSDEGVLIACGSLHSGYALFVKNNRLVHEHNYAGTRYRIESDSEVPAGKATLRFEFQKTGDLQGTGVLLIEGKKVGELDIPRLWSARIALEGLDVGRDIGTPASDDYTSPFNFTGTIHKVVIELGDDYEQPKPEAAQLAPPSR